MAIPKGAKIKDADKKKLEKMKKDGATRSDLARIRFNLLMGHSFAKAKRMAMNQKQDERRAVKKAEME